MEVVGGDKVLFLDMGAASGSRVIAGDGWLLGRICGNLAETFVFHMQSSHSKTHLAHIELAYFWPNIFVKCLKILVGYFV